jgi:hypothetical protein
MHKSVILSFLAVLLVGGALDASAAPPSGRDIVVRAQKDGAGFEVYVEFTVAATVDETWAVLTDYDRMAEIVSSIDSSKVVMRDGNRLEVAQKSHATAGPLKFSTSNLRQVELIPNREIRSRLIKGDLKASDFTTRIIDEGAVMRVIAQGKFVPGALSGSAISVEALEAQSRRQYQELRAEILRRKANEPPPPCLLAKTCEQGPG